MGWALNVSDVTRPIAKIVNGRSDGIKDLRFGYLVEEDWRGRDADALSSRTIAMTSRFSTPPRTTSLRQP